jgi:hypothetical protein
MNAAFIAAVVDTLLPGDTGGADGGPPLPPASVAGVDFTAIASAHSAVFDAVAQQMGNADAFLKAAESPRIAVVQSVERVMPEAFRALLSALLAAYYEAPPVLAAMGWRTDPPQPLGHEMQPSSGAMAQRLERVHRRQKLWRD